MVSYTFILEILFEAEFWIAQIFVTFSKDCSFKRSSSSV